MEKFARGPTPYKMRVNYKPISYIRVNFKTNSKHAEHMHYENNDGFQVFYLVYALIKNCYFEVRPTAMFMTSLWHHTLDHCKYYVMYGKRRPTTILWYQLDVSLGFSFQVRGGCNPPLVNCVKNRGVDACIWSWI